MAGRPTKYKPEYVQKVYEYLKECSRENMKLPKRVDVAILLDVTEDTLNNWAKQHTAFLGALETVDAFQHSRLVDDGIYGGKEVNSTIVKLMLQNNHGYKDQPALPPLNIYSVDKIAVILQNILLDEKKQAIDQEAGS